MPKEPIVMGHGCCFEPFDMRTAILRVLSQVHKRMVLNKGTLHLLHISVQRILDLVARTAVARTLALHPCEYPPLLGFDDIVASVLQLLPAEPAQHALFEMDRVVQMAGSELKFSAAECGMALSRYAAVTPDAAAAMAVALEYITAETLSVAGDAASEFKRDCIAPRHLALAVSHNSDIQCVFARAGLLPLVPGGIVPSIPRRSLPVRGALVPPAPLLSASGIPKYRPETLALRGIRRWQKASGSELLSAEVFRQCVDGRLRHRVQPPHPAHLRDTYAGLPPAAQLVFRLGVSAEMVTLMTDACRCAVAMTVQRPYVRAAAVQMAAALHAAGLHTTPFDS
jgi:hypothetical protein